MNNNIVNNAIIPNPINKTSALLNSKVLKISIIIIFVLLCLPWDWIIQTNTIQDTIMENAKYLFLKYRGLLGITYIILIGVSAYYEPGISSLMILFFIMSFTWDIVGRDIDPCRVDENAGTCRRKYDKVNIKDDIYVEKTETIQ
tara:strand:+ start:593 stop:1024 length:432 start_codon:yes stop_codon:yes gene_type:complete